MASWNHNAAMASELVDRLDLSDRDTAAQVLAVQRAAYRIEADLIGFDGIPQLAESLDELQAKQLEWLGIRDRHKRVTAALAFSESDSVIDIDRLVVAPGSLRRGYARALVSALPTNRTVVVSTGEGNHPARALYESLGFTRTHGEEVVPGLMITHFRREAIG